MSVCLALHDAQTNCARDGATVTLTLKSGATLRGKLRKPPGGVFHDSDVAMLETSSGGWATILIDEIAAVGSER